jgi:DNA ligase-1
MALFAQLADLAEELAGEASRLNKRAAIAEAVRAVHQASGEAAAGLFCLYLAGQPFAEADPRKLNAGGALLAAAVKRVSGCSDAALTAAYRRHGDLGAAAAEVWGQQLSDGSSLATIAEAFAGMAAARTTAVRSALLEGLLRRTSALEAKYLLKLMLGDMRIGVKQSLIEEAIALASGTEVAAVRHAVMLEADLAHVVRMAFAGTLAEARMRLFHPLGFMLASPVETPEEAVERFTETPVKVSVAKPKGRRKQEAAPVNNDASLEAEADAMGAAALSPALESGIEALSGVSMGGVQVHTDSLEPASVHAEAFANGSEIHSGPGQEGHLPHEACLVVQPAQQHVAPVPRLHAYLEDKFDGMRAQLHFGEPTQPGRVALYSRNREEITQSFPELVEALQRAAAALSGPLILDGEVLGWDHATGKALPFSVLGQRIGRKRVDAAMRRAIPVVFMAFDLLFQADELLLSLPLRERRARLEQVVRTLAGEAQSPLEAVAETAQAGLFDVPAPTAVQVPRLMLSVAQYVESAEQIDRAYRDARLRANEGVMLKAAESVYQPGRRGLAWLKLKRELATLDVVITGAEFGHGRRAGLLSDYTFAVLGPAARAFSPAGRPLELLNVGKAYSGVTDAQIAELTAWMKAHTLEDHGHFRTVEPLRVLEVAFNNVMRSDRHSSGFALRFPRILRIRDDKPVEEIDTLQRVAEIYESQPDKGKDPA